MQDLTRWWPLPDRTDLRDELVDAWSSPERGYHDLEHLREVLGHLDLLTGRGEDVSTPLLLAAWFHDAVYDGGPGAEERSARWAETAIDEPALAAEVARLVRVTEHHRPPTGDRAAELLCDADLAILAADPERHREYVDGVRREYAHVDDLTFARGRVAVLEGLLEVEHLFATSLGRGLWEARARANVERELVSLRRAASGNAAPPDAAG